MKPTLVLAVAAVLSASISYAVVRCSPNCAAAAPSSGAASAEEVARLARALGDADARQASLQKSVEDLRAQLSLQSSRDSRVPTGEIEQAVARALEKQAGSTEAASAESAHAALKFDARAAFEDLLAPNLSRDAKMAKWKAIAAAGGLDEVLAMFEEYAKE